MDEDSITSIFTAAKYAAKENITYFRDTGSYNENYELDVNQVMCGALFMMDNNLHDQLTMIEMDVSREPNIKAVESAMEGVEKGKSRFIVASDDKHFALIAIVPDEENRHKVIYVNPLPKNIYKGNKNTETGLSLANEIAKTYELNPVIDKSADQQHNECCGLSAAMNIANIAHQVISEKKEAKDIVIEPIKKENKQSLYQNMGSDVFGAITRSDDFASAAKYYHDEKFARKLAEEELKEYRKIHKEYKGDAVDLQRDLLSPPETPRINNNNNMAR